MCQNEVRSKDPFGAILEMMKHYWLLEIEIKFSLLCFSVLNKLFKRVQRLSIKLFWSPINTVKPLFIVFAGGLKKKQWIREKNNRWGSHN
jgi:hypothetical protein